MEVWCAKLEEWDWEESWVRSCRFFDNEESAKRCENYLKGLGNGGNGGSRTSCEKINIESSFEPALISYHFLGHRFLPGALEVDEYDIYDIQEEIRPESCKFKRTEDGVWFDCIISAISQAQAVTTMNVILEANLLENVG